MKLSLVKGTTGYSVEIRVSDSSSTTGGKLTGLVYNSGSLTAYYRRQGESAATQITLATATLGTWTSGGFKEVSSANMPGAYEFGIPDACLLTGAGWVTITLKGAANMVQVDLEIELTAWNNQDAVRGGMTALPNAAANANGGLPILSSSGTTLAYTISTLTTYTNNTPQTGDAYARIGATGSGLTSLAPASTALSTVVWTAPPTGFLAATFPTTIASPTNITAGTITTVTNLTNLPAITTGWLTAAGIADGAITAPKIADGAIDTATFASGTTLPRVTLVDTLTTYTNNTPQTGDSYARIGATGSGLTSLAPSSTALSTAVWTPTIAGRIDVALSTLGTSVQLVKVLAAVYDSASLSGSTLTLSNGATQTVTSSGRVTA